MASQDPLSAPGNLLYPAVEEDYSTSMDADFEDVLRSLPGGDLPSMLAEEFMSTILSVEDREQDDSHHFNAEIAATMTPITDPSMPLRTQKMRREQQGPYTSQRTTSRYSSEHVSLSALQPRPGGQSAAGSRTQPPESGSSYQGSRASASASASGKATVEDIALETASAGSNNPEQFRKIVLCIIQMFWVNLILCGAILSGDVEILKAKAEALRPYFTARLHFYGLALTSVNPLPKIKMKYAIKSGRTFLKTKATNFLGTVLNIENHHTKNMDQGSDAYASYVDGLTDTFCTGSFFHLPETTEAPYKFRNLQFRNALMRVFYDMDNACLRAKLPVSLANGITIQAIAIFGVFIVHSVHHLKASRLGESLPHLETKTYYPLYEEFLKQLQLELDAKNGFQDYIDKLSTEGSLWIPLVGPEDAITPLPTNS